MTSIRTMRELEAAFEQDDDSAVRENLAAGHPVVYREADTPAGHIIKRYPDGKRELWSYDEAHNPFLVSDLPPAEPYQPESA